MKFKLNEDLRIGGQVIKSGSVVEVTSNTSKQAVLRVKETEQNLNPKSLGEPGQLEFKRVRIRTEKDMDEVEKLVDDGWTITSEGWDTYSLARKKKKYRESSKQKGFNTMKFKLNEDLRIGGQVLKSGSVVEVMKTASTSKTSSKYDINEDWEILVSDGLMELEEDAAEDTIARYIDDRLVYYQDGLGYAEVFFDEVYLNPPVHDGGGIIYDMVVANVAEAMQNYFINEYYEAKK